MNERLEMYISSAMSGVLFCQELEWLYPGIKYWHTDSFIYNIKSQSSQIFIPSQINVPVIKTELTVMNSLLVYELTR